MWQYLLKRLLLMGVTLFGIALVSFLMVTLAPGDPATLKARSLAAGRSANISEQAIKKNRETFFLDRPRLLNLDPPGRTRTVEEALNELLTARDAAARADAAAKLGSTIGSAALGQLIEALPAVVDQAIADTSQAKSRLDALAAAAPAEVPQQLANLLESYPQAAPPAPPGVIAPTPAIRVQGWLRQRGLLRERAQEPARRLLEVLTHIVPEPRQDAETLVDTTAAWLAWWEAHRDEYAPGRGEAAARVWLERGEIPAEEAEPGPELKALRAVAQLAAPALMRALQDASEGSRREQLAGYGLATVCHKPWDLTTSATERAGYENAWQEARDALSARQLTPAALARLQTELGDQSSYVSLREEEEFDRQRYRWNDWWYRAEEYYTDFSGARRAGRAFSQTQFGRWLYRLLRLDFGESYDEKRPVTEILLERLPPTLALNLISIVLAYLIAVPLGIYSATHQGTRGDRLTTVTLFLLYSIPSFWMGSMLILLFTGPPFLDWFPSHHFQSLNAHQLGGWAWVQDVGWHMVLPVLCLTYAELAYISRQMRTGMLEAIRQDYVRTARAKGLSERVVVYKHALRNALIPLLTLMGSLLPLMFAGSVIIESVFTIEGLGKLAFDAILARDYPLIMANLVISACLTLVGILLTDIGYAVVDPRIEFR